MLGGLERGFEVEGVVDDEQRADGCCIVGEVEALLVKRAEGFGGDGSWRWLMAMRSTLEHHLN